MEKGLPSLLHKPRLAWPGPRGESREKGQCYWIPASSRGRPSHWQAGVVRRCLRERGPFSIEEAGHALSQWPLLPRSRLLNYNYKENNLTLKVFRILASVTELQRF